MPSNSKNNQSELDKVYKVPTFRPNWSNRRNATCLGKFRLYAVKNSNQGLKERDPFLYFSQSRRGLDALRYSLGPSANIDDDEDFCRFPVERKSRFSTEVHPMHDSFLLGLIYNEGNEGEVLQAVDGDNDVEFNVTVDDGSI